jgi:antitoxin component YwqK of YwqJK toxin-antitoxin module
MRIFLLTLCATTGLIATAQNDTMFFYFHKNRNQCPREYATYVGYGTKENDLIKVTMHVIETGQLLMSGTFTDTTLSTREGFFEFFMEDGRKQSAGYFKNNLAEGNWALFDYFIGKVSMDSVYYEAGKNIARIHYSYYANGLASSRILTNDRDKIKEFTESYVDGSLKSEARWVKNSGDKVGYYPGGTKNSVETHVNGRLTLGYYYRSDGTQCSKEEMDIEMARHLPQGLKDLEALMPDFPGGHDGFQSHLVGLRIPAAILDYTIKLRKLTVVFMLNEKGRPVDIKIVESDNTELLGVVTRFFNNLPSWKMKSFKEFGPLRYHISF